MKTNSYHILIAAILLISSGLSYGCKKKENVTNPVSQESKTVQFWLTDPAKNIYFTEQQSISYSDAVGALNTIAVNAAEQYQVMDGFGCALTGGSAYHIYNMPEAERKKLLTELFDDKDKNIGISYLRISIGASDLDAKVFSYDDLPAGQTDVDMKKFSLAEDKKCLIPLLKEILAVNPNIKILASPWSAPLWMKTTGKSVGGSLKPEYYDAYSKYFISYIMGMKSEGINIDAITVQNEPLHGGNNPSMVMPASQQAEFIKTSLGPAFKTVGINTKIIIYDHNADRIDYPISVLNDADAKKYIDGSAFHLYGGSINDLSQVHSLHPDKNLYFTEQWVGAGSSFADNLKFHLSELVIGGSRNWCKTVLEWNLASNSALTPHTDGGCDQCLGSITVDGSQVTRNVGYYIMAHASKFVRPGSKRIESNIPASDLPNVAFLTPEGRVVVIVLNNGSTAKAFNLKVVAKNITASLAAGAAGTFVW
ncbi:MAG TPA: glycoside hydrolase family 30 beta sandwich domain-containing protein [Ignavibacteriales bacterium]|nr:glycoside hydrolase family 30 beta sandwich domain-containing protein [Ignavibacteriales bacterium]